MFTAGIGKALRRRARRGLRTARFLGVAVDEQRNADAEPDCDVSAPGAAVRTHVVRAREEVVAARAARALLGLWRYSGASGGTTRERG